MHKLLQDFGSARLQGKTPGIYSVCSSHPWVLEAAMRHALQSNGPLVIEATCNQVNQFGGYTGMTPKDFRQLVLDLAAKVGFPADRLILGGDHLGPYPWQGLSAERAMKNAAEMVVGFVQEGFGKIHLDTSMPCSDDPTPLPYEVIAERAAALAQSAELCSISDKPVYVIGTEVPTPGGAVEELEATVTSYAAAELAFASHEHAFRSAGLSSAWSRVTALVVQPGVEFGHEQILNYDSRKSEELRPFLQAHPELIFEAHSTDYQRPKAYRDLVHDGFAILKVGPALTYAMRQAIFALARVEDESIAVADRSRLEDVLLEAMLKEPESWQKHYQGALTERHRLLLYSYSDRLRYYWGKPAVRKALDTLIHNLESKTISETLLSEFLPNQYLKVRSGELECRPLPLIFDKISEELAPYSAACSSAWVL